MITKILNLIKNNNRFLICAHQHPDGDAIASTLALGNALSEIGKDVVTYNGDKVPSAFNFLSNSDRITQVLEPGMEPFDVGFILDSGSLERAGQHIRNWCRVLVSIDHHTNSERLSEIDYLDQTASSTGTLIYRILRKLPFYSLSLPVGTCIYTALLSDTGSFRFGNTDQESFEIAADLSQLGVDTAEIATQLYENQEEKTLRLLDLALSTLEVSKCGRIASISVTTDQMERTGAGPQHSDAFINYPRSIRGVKVAVFFRQEEAELFKVSFRSTKDLDVGALARELGGGGHANASGATMSGSLKEVSETVFKSLERLLV